MSSYGKEWSLGRLIRELAELDGLERIGIQPPTQKIWMMI